MATETDGSDPIPQLLANSDLVRSVFDSAFFNMPCCTPDVAIRYQHPEQLRFLFASVEEGESYLWEFGDGSTSTDRFPTHIYPAVGTYEVCLTVTNDCGSDMVCEVVDWTVGIAETETELHLVIHPNPSSDMFNFSAGVETISSISICDAIGRVVVMQNAISSSATVSVAGIAPGVYFATVTTDKGVAVQRVVVQ
jgi:PKD repeat protein